MEIGRDHWAQPQGGGQWRVWSIRTLDTYVVDPGAAVCSCPDAKIKKHPCKHVGLLRAHLSADSAAARPAPENPDSERGKEVKKMEIKTEPKEAPTDGRAVEPAGIVPLDSRIPFPLADIATLRKAVDAFIQIRNSILTPDDIYEVRKIGEIARTGWDRIALAYGVSVDVPLLEPCHLDGKAAFKAKAVATIPGGARSAAGHAYCTVDEVNERAGKPTAQAYHFAAAIAESRAVKRAMEGLVGAGDLSQAELEAIKRRK